MQQAHLPEPVHIPVMMRQVIEYLNPHEGGVYVDATVGLGGHSKEILGLIGHEGRLIGMDRDENALAIAKERLGNGRVSLKKANFSAVGKVLGEMLGQEKADGVLFDLGVSMLQLKEAGRGFSFMADEPLDMRMDKAQPLTAERVVNTYPEAELKRILYEYGEERLSGRIARRIVERRPIKTTGVLAGIVERAYGQTYGKRSRTHPATKTFQALRVEVNNELGELGAGLKAAHGVLMQGGRLVVISYHSLEDRVVKNFMRDAGREGTIKVLTKKPLVPDEEEIRENPSARSAKLRAGERI